MFQAPFAPDGGGGPFPRFVMRYIAFLRAINVGARTVKMDRLRGLFEELELGEVSTFIASGNVVFTSPSRMRLTLEKRISEHLFRELGFHVATFVRTDTHVAEIARFAAFTKKQLSTAQALNVALLARPAPAARVRALMELENAVDRFRVKDTEVYWLCCKKQSESTFSNAVLERTLGCHATLRGMKTLVNLSIKYGG